MKYVRDAMFIVGLGLLAGGLYLYDLRIAMVAVGATLVLAAMMGTLRDTG